MGQLVPFPFCRHLACHYPAARASAQQRFIEFFTSTIRKRSHPPCLAALAGRTRSAGSFRSVLQERIERPRLAETQALPAG
jgi:hypothetical protein